MAEPGFTEALARLVPLLAIPVPSVFSVTTAINPNTARDIDLTVPPTMLSHTLHKRAPADYGDYGVFSERTENSRQRARRQKAEAKRQEYVPYDLRPALTDAEMIQRFANKIQQHKQEIKDVKRTDRIGDAHQLHEKWLGRQWAVTTNNQDGLLENHKYYFQKENNPKFDSEKQAKNRRKKNYYHNRLMYGYSGGGGGSSTAASPAVPESAPTATPPQVPTPGQTPGTPHGEYQYGSVPTSPLFDPHRYAPGNWGEGGYQ